MTTQSMEDKENSEVSTYNDQISKLTQEVQNMGKVLAVITENRTNQQFQPQYSTPTIPNMGQCPQLCGTIQQQPPPKRIQWSTPKPRRWKFLGRYCHLCGNCDHWRNRCSWKKQGHDIRA